MIGKTVSHYRIIEKIGEGGMGIVYKALDLNLDRFAALKFLPPHLSSSEEKERFIHEAKTASASDHINICTIYEIDEIKGETGDGQLFISMAYYEGETLKCKIEKGRLKINETLEIIIQITEGLKKAHKKGIVHRDIKPANIIISEDGVAKILDFGIAKLSGGTQFKSSGSTFGSLEYMSPEQIEGDELDQQTDIWSLGVILYEMITGERPFQGDYNEAVIYSILNEEPRTVSNLISDFGYDLSRIINRQSKRKKLIDINI
jgi:serine/threonine protein kinase